MVNNRVSFATICNRVSSSVKPRVFVSLKRRSLDHLRPLALRAFLPNTTGSTI